MRAVPATPRQVMFTVCGQCPSLHTEGLRETFGPTEEANGIWRIKTKRELDELIEHRNTINCVKAQRLSWFGHTNRVAVNSGVERMQKWKPFTGRATGRLRCGWEGDVRNGVKEMM